MQNVTEKSPLETFHIFIYSGLDRHTNSVEVIVDTRSVYLLAWFPERCTVKDILELLYSIPRGAST